MKKAVAILKVWAVEAIISIIMIAILAFLMLNLRLGDKTLQILIYGVYALVNIFGGMVIGKMMQSRRFAWGALNGLVYMAMIVLISMVCLGTKDIVLGKIMTEMVISILAGMFGGMIS